MLMKIETLRRSWLVLSLLAGACITGLTPLRSLAQEQPAESGRQVSVEIEVWQLDGLPKMDLEEIPRNGNLARLQVTLAFLESKQKRNTQATKLAPPKHVTLKTDGQVNRRLQFAVDAQSTWLFELRPAPIGEHEMTLDYDLVRRAGGKQVQVSDKQQVQFGSVAACCLRASAEKNNDETAAEWLVFLRPRLRNPDESDVVIPVDIGREATPIGAAFIPRVGIYQLQVAEGWSGYLWPGSNDASHLFSLSGSTNIGKSADARASDNHIPLERFRAERPVLEVVYSDDGFINVVARRPGFASLRSQIQEPDGQTATCELQIVVAADTTEIDQAIRTVLPRANIKTAMVRDALLLTGTIADADELSLLDEVAGQFAPKIINRVKVAGERLPVGKTRDFPVEPAAASAPAGPRDLDRAPRQISPAAVEPSRARPRRRAAAELKAIHDEVRGLRDDVRKLSELLERRLAAESAPKPVGDDRIQVALNTIVAVEFRDTPLDEVLRKFSEMMEVNLVLDTRSLEEVGLKRTAPVSMVMSGVSARSALKLILEPLNLTFMEENEVLMIVSRQRSKGELIVKTYSVEQLQSIFRKRQPGQSRAGALEELRQLIVQSIQPDTWDEFGGPASIRVHVETDSLVVRQTSDVHVAIVELLEQIRRLKQLPKSADNSSDTQLFVVTYAIADLVVPIPGAEGLNVARTSGWLNVYDRLITEIAPQDWKDNGGRCSIEVHEQTLSLIIRATRSIHEQVEKLLDAIRREHDVQVCIEQTFLPPLSDSVLQQAGLKLEFDPRTNMAQIDERTARQLIAAVHQSNQEVLFAPKITLFNGQIGHLKWQDRKLYVRALVADNRESVRLNVAVNPNNPEIAMTRNSQRLPDDGYLLVDITDHHAAPDPRTKPGGRSLALLHPRIVQPEEVQEPNSPSGAVKP
ncbi:MAG: hypothetical protein JSS49_02215 [Planctomycetes bacterium]|nr:hypothetical protein [Planctomycetota bacterium]